jgi:hypothetical protein
MSARDLKQINPDLFKEVYNLGIKAEKRRRYNIRRQEDIRAAAQAVIHQGRNEDLF